MAIDNPNIMNPIWILSMSGMNLFQRIGLNMEFLFEAKIISEFSKAGRVECKNWIFQFCKRKIRAARKWDDTTNRVAIKTEFDPA